jgi:hypothetical protein
VLVLVLVLVLQLARGLNFQPHLEQRRH